MALKRFVDGAEGEPSSRNGPDNRPAGFGRPN